MTGRKAKDRANRKGQGLVETAIILPVMLLVLSSLVELAFMLNDYLGILDAARNAARFSSDSLYEIRDADLYCSTTRDFYRQTMCLVCQELDQEAPPINLNLDDPGDQVLKSLGSIDPDKWYDCPLDSTIDDVIVSAASINAGTGGVLLFPAPNGYVSLYNHFSPRITAADIQAALNASAPSTGYVVVEIFFHYQQRLGLPWVKAFLPDPVPLHTYAIMPLVSAEPTSTPIPLPP